MLSSITSRFVSCGEAAIHCGRQLWRVRVEILSLVGRAECELPSRYLSVDVK